MTAQEQSRFMLERHGIAWWWRAIGDNEWIKATGGMSRTYFVKEHQECALRYEWQARHTATGEPRKGRPQYAFGKPWIDLTYDQREELLEQFDPAHGVIQTGKRLDGSPAAKPNECDAPALKQVLSETVVRYSSKSPGPWSAPVSLNLSMQTETLLAVLREHLDAERASRGIEITQQRKGGRLADPWRAIEIADVMHLPLKGRPFDIGDSERSQLSKFRKRMAEFPGRVKMRPPV